MSSVTRWIVSWIWLRNARPASVDGVGTVAALARSGGPSAGRPAPPPPTRWGGAKRQTRVVERGGRPPPGPVHPRTASAGGPEQRAGGGGSRQLPLPET